MGYHSDLDIELQNNYEYIEKGYPSKVGQPYREEIYILHGSTGEYEDYREWVVFAFRKKSEALEYKDLLDRVVSTHNQNSTNEYEEDVIIEEKLRPYDEKAQVEGFIHYFIQTVTLHS
jgi:hypothetical protein